MQAVLRDMQLIAFVAVAAVAAYEWWRRRTEAAAWMTATVMILAYVVAAGRALPPAGPVADVVRSVNVAILALFPFALYRFMRSFLPAVRPLSIIAPVSTVVIVAWALVVDLPSADEPRTGAAQAFVVLFAVHWTVLSFASAVRLWRAGSGQPRIARTRMRLLGGGAVALNVALLLAAFAGGAPDAVGTVTAALTLLSALGFFLAFAPPGPLRSWWRRSAERVVRGIQLQLVASIRPEDVGRSLAPFVDEVLGGQGTVLLDESGRLVAVHGMTRAAADDVVARIDGAEGSSSDLLVVGMRAGTLVIEASPFTPYFGREELDLLEGLAAYLDLALERTELAARERAVREELTRANAELEALVFGISHDLKSPIITLLGFVDLLRTDYGDLLDDQARHYLSRLSVSALYMQDLLNDLLELSRIGRVRVEARRVDLDELVADVAEHVATQYPAIRVEADPLPTVLMGPGRARQLFTNLIENAAKHGGRHDVTIRVEAVRRLDDDGVEIRISDDGRGIPREYREKVFGIFERLDDGGVSTHGTGIGLAICRKILEEVDGEIALLDGDGGTTFRILLPQATVVHAPVRPRTMEARS